MSNTTESCCEVVKIVNILPHPNADRLEIAKFAFADGTIPDYQVVVGKGEFAIGSLAVYISDDMLVPVSRPEFEFLKDKAKGGYHRVRACRLRGQMSTGLLVKISDISNERRETVSPGKDMSTLMGVLKYVNPLEQKEHSCVNTGMGNGGGVLNRLVRWLGKKLYNPVKPPEYSVLSLRKVPDLFTEGEPVIVTEKIHGSNIRFGKINGKIYIGSHHVEKSDRRPWYVRGLFASRKKNTGGYYGKDVWSEWFYRKFDSKAALDQLPNNIIFYGELFGPGIQPWTYGLLTTQVLVYDAYDLKSKRWLSYTELLCELPSFLNLVPRFGHLVGGIGFSKENIKKLAESDTVIKSWFTTDPKHKCNDREGVVVRSVDWKKAGKLVSDRYLASEH